MPPAVDGLRADSGYFRVRGAPDVPILLNKVRGKLRNVFAALGERGHFEWQNINCDPFSGSEIARILGFMCGDNSGGPSPIPQHTQSRRLVAGETFSTFFRKALYL